MKNFPDANINKIEEKIAQFKEAEVTTELLPHQTRVVEKLKKQPGLLVAHPMGLGKTLSSISALDTLQQPATVITPAALKGNYAKEVQKHTTTPLDIHQDSLENIARKGTAKLNPVLVVDEAHRARNAGKTLDALKRVASKADKRILLTGTPMVNRPSDIAPLINIVSGETLLPEDRTSFENKYVYEKQVSPGLWNKLKGIKPGIIPVLNKHEKENLRNMFQKWVDYEEGSKEGFPDVEEQEIKVPMTARQTAIYDTMLGDAPAWVAAKIKAGLPPDKAESKSLNEYANAIRQISNTTAPFTTGEVDNPKIQRAFEELQNVLKDPQAKGVVYSNYLKAGLEPYKKLLEENKIPFGEFSGNVKQKDREQIVKDYNEGKLRALLLSSAGGTGLDLKNTSVMQLLESNWNDPVLDQAKARAIRYQSHADLPEDKRKVLVQRFLATRPQSISQRLGLTKPDLAIDEYLQNLASQKTNLNNQFRELMKTANLQKAEEIKNELKKKYNVTPFLTGSLRLGTNLPGKYDYDFNIHLESKAKFDALRNKFEKIMDSSKYNKPGTDHHIFTTNIKGEEVDLALTYGDKGKKYQDSVRAAEKKLTPSKIQEIVKEKERLQNAWFFKERRYKDYKKNLDEELGIMRFSRDPIKEAENYNRSDIYGHRTSNLDSIIEHGLLSAFDAHKKGLLKSTESGNSVLSTIFNNRGRSSEPVELKTNIYTTKGLMPADSTYGPYGVLFRSRSMEPSKHLNFIPEEHLTKQVKGKLTFVVPDSEFEDWTKKHPEKKFLRESEVPNNKKLESASYSEPIKRLLSGAKFTHESEKVAGEERKKLMPLIGSKLVETVGQNGLIGLKDALEKKERDMHFRAATLSPHDEKTILENRVNNLGKQVDLVPDIVTVGSPGARGGFPKFEQLLKSKNIGVKDPTMSQNTVRGFVDSTDATILHELGHLKNQAKFSEPLRLVGGLFRQASGYLPSVAATAYTSTQDDPSNKVGLGFLGLSMPTLAGEAGATYHAFKHLIKQKGVLKGLRSGANLIPAFGTYALNASMPLIGTQVNKYFNREKTAQIAVPLKYQNTQRTCSAACLRMVLSHYGLDKSEEDVAKKIGVHERGAEGDQIEKAAKEYDFKAEWKEFSPEDVISLLEKEIPIIADIKSFNYENKNHWVVIEEIDLKNNKVRIADPNVKGNRRYISLTELDERWKSRNMYTGEPLTRAAVIVYPK